MVVALPVRCVAATLAVVLLWATPAGAVEFVDDDGRPGERALEWLAERGIIDGCDPPANRRSCPTEVINRAQAAKVIVLAGRHRGIFAETRPADVDHFVDDGRVWNGAAEPIIGHLADLRVVHGCDPPANQRFCPYDKLRRGQVTKMIVLAFGLTAPSNFKSPWRDTAGQFYAEAARIAAYHGLLDSSGGVFDGDAEVTRDEFARMVVAVFEPGLCRDDPFTGARKADLEADHLGVDFTAYVFDFATGCAYAMNPGSRQQTASVFKVMVMAGTLYEAQSDARSLTASEWDLLSDMIRISANPPVRTLWRRFGAAPWFTLQAERFLLDETDPLGDHDNVWGRTRTSAYDQGRLLHRVLLGEDGILSPEYSRLAMDLMTSVAPSQTWGVTAGVPDGWKVAQKNGFAGQTTNSVGMVFDEEGAPRYTVVVLTFGWSHWEQGVSTVERIAGWVAAEMVG